jgi:hypothetical protein
VNFAPIAIVAESNFGSEMARATIQAADRNAPVRLVTASRGKAVRAAPISVRNAQGQVHHVGQFGVLTGLILTYTNADVRVTLNGYVYAVNSILVDGLKFKCAAGLEVDQQQITLSARATDTVGGVSFLQSLRNGVFDGCEIQREQALLNSWSRTDTANPIGTPSLTKSRTHNSSPHTRGCHR